MTGLRPDSDDIIEIAAVRFQGEKVLGRWQTLVRPSFPLPFRTEQFTGITAAEAASAPPLAAVTGQLVSFVRDYPIVGQSIPQDIAFLARKGIALTNVVYDTFDLASILLPEISNYSLASLAEYFNIRFPVQHRAMPDAEVSKDVFNALWERAMDLDLAIVGEINRLTSNSQWPLRYFFREVEKAKSRSTFQRTIGAQLASKMGLEETNLEFLLGRGRRQEPLRPKAEKLPVDVESVCSLLAADSPLESVIDSFEHRPEQVRMAAAVAEALNHDRHLMVEAGTGTGKSLAYLLPVLSFSLQNDAHVVISTNTINLQDQLIGKDIPSVERFLSAEAVDAATRARFPSLPWGKPLKVALVKGRSNYLCLRRWSHLRRAEGLSLDEIKVLIRLLVWLPSTATGDRSEMNLMPGEASVWSKVCAQVENCLGSQCNYQKRGTCFLHRARRAAEASHVIVVNHALLLSDVAAGTGILPEFDYLIVDEAHHLEEEATEQWGFEVDERMVDGYLNELSEHAGGDRWLGLLSEVKAHFRGSTVSPARIKEIDRLTEEAHARVAEARPRQRDFFAAALNFMRRRPEERNEYDQRLRLTRQVRSQPEWKEVEIAWENLQGALIDIERSLGSLQTAFEGLSEAKILDYEELMLRFSSLLFRSSELRRQLDAIIVGREEASVHWLTLNGRTGTVHLSMAPLHVGHLLQRSLFATKRSVVLTSATLAVANDFDYMKGRLGLEDCQFEMIGSPFDYKRTTRVYIPDDIPEPNHPGYQRAIEHAIIDICRSTGGRTLVLFTSHSALRAVHAAVRGPLEREHVLVLGHEIDGSRKQLLSTLQNNPHTVLLGTSSFWEGVDIVGEALRVLIIAKLPFSVPTDPIFAARSETFRDAFNEYAVPQTILRLKQGFGRLIRSKKDTGVVVILDRRIQTKGYGQVFLKSLPPAPVSSVSADRLGKEVASWLVQVSNGEPTGG